MKSTFIPNWHAIQDGQGVVIGKWFNHGPIVTVTDGRRTLTAQSHIDHKGLARNMLRELKKIALNDPTHAT